MLTVPVGDVAAALLFMACVVGGSTTPRVQVDDPETAAQICKRRRAVTVLPDAFAKSLGLTRLRLSVGATTPLYLLYRPTLTIAGRTEAVVEALRAALKADA
jgi:DNA-binding transcriptional LysR family regulator